MPSIVLTILAKINSPEIPVAEIEKLIKMDPGLVSYILKLTNSVIFGLREEVYSISRAIILLGMSNLRSVLTSYSIRLLCKAITNVHAQEYLWHHSLSVAVMSKVISEKIHRKEHPNAYVFGLLHDVGKIVLFMHDSQKFQECLEQGVHNNLNFVQAEYQTFGYSHIETGFFMVEKLGFSRTMKNIVLFHHDPEFGPSDDKMHWVVSLANELAHNIFDNKEIDLNKYLKQVNISESEFNDAVNSAQTQVMEYRNLL